MNGRILVVEDQEDNRKIMRDLLRHAEYEVMEAGSGDECIAMAKKLAPDLIIMDIQLPGIDGYKATRLIKSDPTLGHIPVVAVTSYALSGDQDRAREAGCDAYFAKPVDTRALLAKVREFSQNFS